jgi:hypothetical protein
MYRIVQCAGSNLQDCTIDGQIDGSESALDVSSDNWMIKGVTITNLSPGAAHSYCLQATGNHIAFVNVYVHDCSWSASATTKDYVAWIGVLLFRAATSTAASGGGCPSNLSDITPLSVDKNAGTHKFYKGFFSMRAHWVLTASMAMA